MDDFERSVKEALGEKFNVAYVKNILSKSDEELFKWFLENLRLNIPFTLNEVFIHYKQYQKLRESEYKIRREIEKQIASFGLEIVMGNLNLLLFILNELKLKMEAGK